MSSIRIYPEVFFEHPRGATLRMVEVSPEYMAELKKKLPDLRGIPTYFTVKRDGLKLEFEIWPQEEDT